MHPSLLPQCMTLSMSSLAGSMANLQLDLVDKHAEE